MSVVQNRQLNVIDFMCGENENTLCTELRRRSSDELRAAMGRHAECTGPAVSV